LTLQELQKMQKLSGALDFAQFPHGLQTQRRRVCDVMLFPVPGCSRILQLSAYYARVALIIGKSGNVREPGTSLRARSGTMA
jgi:hypothetical protein